VIAVRSLVDSVAIRFAFGLVACRNPPMAASHFMQTFPLKRHMTTHFIHFVTITTTVVRVASGLNILDRTKLQTRDNTQKEMKRKKRMSPEAEAALPKLQISNFVSKE
jgi:hypothetical protein